MHLVILAAAASSTIAISVPALAFGAISGWVIPALVDLITKAKAPTELKTVLATALSVLAGAMVQVVFAPGQRWQDYLLSVAWAIVNTQGAHRVLQGLGDPVQNAKPDFGLGAATDAPDGTPTPDAPVSATPTGQPVEPDDGYFPAAAEIPTPRARKATRSTTRRR